MKPLPDDLQDVINQIEAADRAADTLSAALTDQQFHWQPEGGMKWSVAQCLDHLAVTNVLYGGAIRAGIAAAREKGWVRRGPLAPGPFGRWFIRSLEPPSRVKARAQGKVQPGSGLSRDQILQRYHDAHAQVKALVHDSAGIDANRATFPNPFVRWARVKVATGLLVIPAHDRRHLWQAEGVTRRADFPGR